VGAVPEVALDVLLAQALAEHLVHVASAARVGLPAEDRDVGATDDLLGLLAGPGVLLAVLGARPQRLADLLLGPAVVDDAAAVETEPRRVGLAVEDVLVGAADDPVGVRIAAIGAGAGGAVMAAVRGAVDPDRRD